MIFEWTMDDIIDFSKKSYRIKEKKYENGLTLKEFIKKFDIKESVYYAERNSIDIKFAEMNKGYDKVLEKIFPESCLYNTLLSDNPPHMARYAITVYCKDVLKFTEEQVFDLMQSRNWADKHNKKVCMEQIHHIYRKNYHRAKEQSKRCKWFTEHGLCIGRGCRYFR